MKDQLISLETAKLAKNAGFDIPTALCYSDFDEYALPFNAGNEPHINSKHSYYSAISQSIMQRWLREEHKIRVFVTHGISGNFNYEIRIFDKPNDIGHWTRIGHISSFETYEDALEAGLMNGLKLIKK